MRKNVVLALLLGGVLIGSDGFAPVANDRFIVPEGFRVEEVVPPDSAGSVVSITFDSRGRLVLAKERGPVVTVIEHEDGTIEQRIFTEEVHTSQGMFFDGPDLLSVGYGPDSLVGLWRVYDLDGRGGRVELVEELFGGMGGDHGPHHPFFGPDGYLYLTLGNATGLMSRASPLSPLRSYRDASLYGRTDPRGHATEWRAPGGIFVRKDLSRPESDWDLFAGGFRNQYDGGFNMMGELFTFDSDMEWDRNLPWFRPIRTVHVVPGGDYGWRTGSMKHPDYFIDGLPPAEDLGRGSPTGTVFYQSYAYPEEYWDAFIQADWSRGRIILGKPVREGATYVQHAAVDETTTENFVYGRPLNVTGIDVGPDGYLYFALGGRNTQGGVYRVVYEGPDRPSPRASDGPVDRVITLPQPRSAFSRAATRAIREEMGETAWRQALVQEARNATNPERRVRALELLQVYGPGLDEDFLVSLRDDEAWEVRAAATYYLGLHATDSARRELAGGLRDEDPFVQRRAAEALLRTGVHPAIDVPFSAVDDVLPLLASPDRFVRYAGRALLREMNPNSWQNAVLSLEAFPEAAEGLMAYVQSLHSPYIKDVTVLLDRQLELLEANPTDEELLPLLRVMQRTMMEDLGVRFARRSGGPGPYPRMGEWLLERFPSADSRVNREIARALVHLQAPGAVGRLAAELDNPENDREQQIFYADALSYFSTGWDEETVDMMVRWLEKVQHEGWRGGASFPGFIQYIRDDFLKHVPGEHRVFAAERLEQLDRELAAMPVVSGSPATSRHGLSDVELEEELIYSPDSYRRDPAAGAAAYEKALCASCHAFGPIGIEFGPDLTTIGQRFSRTDLVRKLLRPSETVADLWVVEEFTRADGQVVAGTVYREDPNEVVVQVAAGAQVTILAEDIVSRQRSGVSAMPEGLHHYLTRDEAIELMMFLEAGPDVIPDSIRAKW